MSTKSRERLDSIARSQGWTHRRKGHSRDPYLKWIKDLEGSNVSEFVDQDQKFRVLSTEEVVELEYQNDTP